jgi:hypothetical protein
LIALLSAAWGYLCASIAELGTGGLLIPVILSGASQFPFVGADIYFGRYFSKAANEVSFSYPASDPAFENRIYLKVAALWGVFCLMALGGRRTRSIGLILKVILSETSPDGVRLRRRFKFSGTRRFWTKPLDSTKTSIWIPRGLRSGASGTAFPSGAWERGQ